MQSYQSILYIVDIYIYCLHSNIIHLLNNIYHDDDDAAADGKDDFPLPSSSSSSLARLIIHFQSIIHATATTKTNEREREISIQIQNIKIKLEQISSFSSSESSFRTSSIFICSIIISIHKYILYIDINRHAKRRWWWWCCW